MPAHNPNSNDYFVNMLAEYGRRLHALESQQNHGCTDANGKLRLRWGLQPDKTYGMWALDPTTGDPVLKLKGTALELLSSGGTELLDLTDTGLALYDATGHELVKLDDTGQTVYDATGHELVKLGAQPGGGYGLSVRNAAGKMARVSAPSESFVTTTLSTSSTTWTTLSGPSVTVTVGEAGKALVMPSSVIGLDGGTDATNRQGFVGVQVDSGTVQSLLSASVSKDSVGYIPGVQFTCANTYLWSGLSAGSHTFTMLYASEHGQSIHFSVNSLVVIPY